MFLLLFFSHLTPSLATEFTLIADYLPGSDVTQHSRIDLDQRDFMFFLKKTPPDFVSARSIYSQGGNSLKTSTLTLNTALTTDFPKGASVFQNTTVIGVLNAEAFIGDVDLKVGTTSPCFSPNAQFNGSGCFTKDGGDVLIQKEDNTKISVGGLKDVPLKWRTLEGFSREADKKMAGQSMFELYRAYYGIPDYADEFVRNALHNSSSDRSQIPFDFSDKEDIYRVECAQKGSAYWAVWMYVIREMEDAVQDCFSGCHNCNDAPVHAWDEAWAFYAGSLEGTKGNSNGTLLYRLAEKRCKNFGTCKNNVAMVNTEIRSLFNSGKTALSEGRCGEVKPLMVKIVNLMTVPLIQGTLRYAFKTDDGKGGPKEKAEGVAFLGAFLPRLNNCSKEDAETVKSLMWIDGTMAKGSFSVVKGALERNYACLGITCSQVGALPESKEGSCTPCTPCTEGGLSAGGIVGIVILILVIVVLVAGGVFWMKRRRNSGSKFLNF